MLYFLLTVSSHAYSQLWKLAVGSFEFAPSVAEKLPNRFLLGSIASENGEAATADTDGK